MKCPKCQFDNPERSKLCFQSGGKFELQCPQCGTTLPPVAQFCNECGHRLALPSESLPQAPSFEEKLERIQRYLPGGLTEKILAQRGKLPKGSARGEGTRCWKAATTTMSWILTARPSWM